MDTTLAGARLLLVNPPLYPHDFRGESHAPDRWKSERAMNFGLLVVASSLAKRGAEVEIVDLEETPGDPLQHLAERIAKTNPHVVGVGNISVFSYLGSLDVLATAKAVSPKIRTIIGGQNAYFFLDELAAQNSPADAVALGEGEHSVAQWVGNVLSGREADLVAGIHPRGRPPEQAVFAPAVDIDAASDLLYDLYPGWRTFFPLVEESRGCPYACSFCASERIYGRSIRIKNPELLTREIARASRLWGMEQGCPLVLMCSNFGVNAKLTEEFLTSLHASGVQPLLMTALRVDGPWRRYVALMEGLFDQVHFGLESASPEILLRMNKTGNPQHYLGEAKAAFQAFKKHRMHVAINFVMGFLGENAETLASTWQYVTECREWIDSAWGGALMSYPGSPFAMDWAKATRETGARPVTTHPLSERLRTFPVHPSACFDFDDMCRESVKLMKSLNSARTFYEHYRWYPGPDPDRLPALDFYTPGRFYSLFLQGLAPGDVGFDHASLDAYLAGRA